MKWGRLPPPPPKARFKGFGVHQNPVQIAGVVRGVGGAPSSTWGATCTLLHLSSQTERRRWHR